jgi:hypothetical protein
MSHLKEAYCNTRFTLFELPFEIKVGQLCPALDELLQKHGVKDWAYITAWNPRSKSLSEKENEDRQEDLKAMLKDYRLLEGEGIGADTSWPPERSALVLGIPKAEAANIGRKFEQNAIVVGRLGQTAELLELFDFE